MVILGKTRVGIEKKQWQQRHACQLWIIWKPLAVDGFRQVSGFFISKKILKRKICM
jgi:hypothetical protein